MDIVGWLLGGESWLQFAARINLLHEDKALLHSLKDDALKDVKISGYLQDIERYHADVVSTHKNPALSVHKLLFLLDLGFDSDVPQIAAAVSQIMAHKDAHGVFQSLVNIPKHFGGSGEDTFGWCLCDAPLLMLALLNAGVNYEEHIQQGVRHLVSLFSRGAFPCVASGEFGKFRGPGRKYDCCPYATLLMLRLFDRIPEYKDSETAVACLDTLLSLWENSREAHPYMFYMGTDFRKLKAPPIWYDIVSVADCLSRYPSVRADSRFREMLSVIESKQDGQGRFTPESVYQKCADWDFGQKKVPSPYLTYCCTRILRRAHGE